MDAAWLPAPLAERGTKDEQRVTRPRLTVASSARAAGKIFEKREKSLDSWYSSPIIRGKFCGFVTRARVVNQRNMTAATSLRLEADTLAKRLPDF
jgi:hypothetical protein